MILFSLLWLTDTDEKPRATILSVDSHRSPMPNNVLMRAQLSGVLSRCDVPCIAKRSRHIHAYLDGEKLRKKFQFSSHAPLLLSQCKKLLLWFHIVILVHDHVRSREERKIRPVISFTITNGYTGTRLSITVERFATTYPPSGSHRDNAISRYIFRAFAAAVSVAAPSISAIYDEEKSERAGET